MQRCCPKCGEPLIVEHPEPDVGIYGGYYCDDCDYSEPYGDDE